MLLRQFILIVIFSSQLIFLLLPVISVTDDAEILLRTKNSHIEDPTGLLDDWIQTDNSPCNWTGIACDPLTSAVNIIDLAGFGVSGAFPADFCLIPTLQNLSLSDNFFNGSITTDLISSCSNLRYLNLSINLFVGDLPDFSSEFSNLSWLDLSRNNFSGEIPVCYGRFPNLQDLNLFGNLLNGTIPSFLSNLSELVRLDLGYNPFTPGPLPPEIGDLTKLEYLWLPFSNLVGEIPETFGKLFSLRKLDLSNNYLSGEIPNSIGLLKNIKQIELYSNRFSGELPESLGNLTTLISFDASQNNLTGKLPENLAGLGLTSLGLNDNYLEGEIPRTLALNPNLVQLMLFNNRLSGSLPVDLGRNSDMEDFDVSGNNLVGKLPPFLCYRKKLRRLIAFNNKLSGNLPESYGDCISLTYVRIFNNELSGTIPDHFWGLPNLYLLELKNNRFDGLIPPAISGSRELTQLIIFENQFSGELPKEICEMPELAVLDTSKNRLSGELPSCINKLGKLGKLHLEENMFSGMIPNNVSSWVYLTDLNLANNRFSGKIPSELGNLATLTYLDMSQNLLSGEIPAQLGNLKLNKFNVSSNNLSGKIPSGFDKSIYLPSLIGNPNLCSQNLKPFPPCPKTISSTPFLITVFICLAFLLLVSLFWFYKSKTKSIGGKTKPRWKLTSFYNMNFDEQEIFASLREENLIGTGSSGKVYMARLKTGQIVAVKRLCQGYEKTGRLCVHESEVDTLGRIRHGNIVKLLFSCIGENIRILVYEYMENGSLGDIIYAEKAGVLLDWHKRYKIAIGAAQGLAYLHHDCQPPIVHRDIKPNNILLDEEFFPRLADFGLAKALQDERSDDKNDMSCIAGSYGYIAPEYAYTMKVTEKSDVYSFGVVLMELITGKKPTDSSFGQNKDIVKWVGEAATASEDNFSSLHHLVDTKMHPSNSDYTEIEKILGWRRPCKMSEVMMTTTCHVFLFLYCASFGVVLMQLLTSHK